MVAAECHDGCREFRLKTVVDHRLVQDLAQTRRIRYGRSGHPGKDDIGDDAHLSKSARDMTDHGLGKPEDPVGDAPRIHQIPREDEKGDRKQRKTGRGGIHPLRQHGQEGTIA